MQEQVLLEVPASPANGTNDLLSRLYREIGISAVSAALEITPSREERPMAEVLSVAVASSAR